MLTAIPQIGGVVNTFTFLLYSFLCVNKNSLKGQPLTGLLGKASLRLSPPLFLSHREWTLFLLDAL